MIALFAVTIIALIASASAWHFGVKYGRSDAAFAAFNERLRLAIAVTGQGRPLRDDERIALLSAGANGDGDYCVVRLDGTYALIRDGRVYFEGSHRAAMALKRAFRGPSEEEVGS